MEATQVDFHSTFRTLSTFKLSLLAPLQDSTSNSTHPKEGPVSSTWYQFIINILKVTPEPERLDHGAAAIEWLEWLELYAMRIKNEEAEWSAAGADIDIESEREQEMKNVNPRFVLRQWLLEEVIGKVERDPDSGKRVLAKVMHVSADRWNKE